MKDKFFEAINKFELIQNGDSILVGFSGGADSLCLIDLLYKNKDELNIKVCAAHVNHCLRGEESDFDEQFVTEYCKQRNIQLFVKRIDINSLCKISGQSTELCAREERYRFFSSLGFNKIATAHTGSDSIETMLMNLSRGSSLHGLCSIPAKRDNIIRPLILFTREETEKYCKDNSLLFVTDSSNLTNDYTRNKFRHIVVNDLKSINPSFEQNALRCIDFLREEDAFITSEANTAYNACIIEGRLKSEKLKAYPQCIQRRVIARYISDNCNSDYEAKHINYIQNYLTQSFAVTLPSGIIIKGDGLNIIFVKPVALQNDVFDEISFNKNSGYNGYFGKNNINVYITDTKPKPNINECVVDFFKLCDIINIRSRKGGDEITLKKRHCTKSLKKLFNEQKINAGVRASIPVFSDEKGIICVSGIGADASREPSNNTEKYLVFETECENYD